MNRATVLLVDDQPANLTSFESLLEDLDVTLLCASSGQQALKMLLDNDVAVVLLDVQMPEMDGYEVARLMQKWSHTRDTPIIFVTAINRDVEHILRGYESGAVDFLTKPIDPLVLRSKVRVFLELDTRTRELAASLDTVRKLKEHNELLLRSVGEGIFSLDTDGVITYANPEAQALLGIPEPLTGEYFVRLFEGRESAAAIEAMLSNCRAGERWQQVLSARRHDGHFPAEIVATPMYDRDEEVTGLSLIMQDVSARQARENTLREENERDDLTGLANRRGFERELRERLAAAPDRQAVLMMDLDRFESVNDKLGRQAGDAVLCQVAGRLKRTMRDTDLIARMEGDNFCIILSAEDPAQAARAVADKLLQTAAEPIHFGNVPLRLGASLGIALGSPESTPGSMMHRADQVLSLARRSGGNQYALAGRESTGQAREGSA